jgi:ribosome-associated translation inhibitor RaiA
MEIVSRGQNVPVSDALNAHCVERAQRALRPFSSRIPRVKFVFVDLNGPKGGPGNACRVTIDLVGGAQVRYESRGADYYQCGSHAIMGAARHIQRVLQRRRSHAATGDSTPPPAA